MAASTSVPPSPSSDAKLFGGGSPRKWGNSESRQSAPGARNAPIRALVSPFVVTRTIAGPVSVRPSEGASASASVLGKRNRTHEHQALAQSSGLQGLVAAGGSRSSSPTSTLVATPPGGRKTTWTWFSRGSSVKASTSRTTTTSSPGPANGLETAPSSERSPGSLAGITLQEPPAIRGALSRRRSTPSSLHRRG